jgi:hypothetical protein
MMQGYQGTGTSWYFVEERRSERVPRIKVYIIYLQIYINKVSPLFFRDERSVDTSPMARIKFSG